MLTANHQCQLQIILHQSVLTSNKVINLWTILCWIVWSESSSKPGVQLSSLYDNYYTRSGMWLRRILLLLLRILQSWLYSWYLFSVALKDGWKESQVTNVLNATVLPSVEISETFTARPWKWLTPRNETSIVSHVLSLLFIEIPVRVRSSIA